MNVTQEELEQAATLLALTAMGFNGNTGAPNAQDAGIAHTMLSLAIQDLLQNAKQISDSSEEASRKGIADRPEQIQGTGTQGGTEESSQGSSETGREEADSGSNGQRQSAPAKENSQTS